MIPSYSYTPESDTELDKEICDKKNQIEQLREDVKKLELEKAKSNNEYIGRIFEMEDCAFKYVTGYDSQESKLYGISFYLFEDSLEIISASYFNVDKIKREITKEEFRNKAEWKLGWDKLKELMES